MKSYIVDLGLLRQNTRYLIAQAGDAAVYGVVKGNGYGMGLLPLAGVLWECGVTRFAVAEPEEATVLRREYPEAEILMMRETRLTDELRQLMDAKAVLTVGSTETAEIISSLARETGVPCTCHVKIDTGMGRYGFPPDDLDAISGLYTMDYLAPRGIYTHFHSAFGSEQATRAQFAAFQGVLAALADRGIDPGVRHCCNSSAFLRFPEMHLDAVRLGSAVVGRLSFASDAPLTPVGWCEAQVEVVRTIPKGHSVGYGAMWTARRDTRIAVIGVGTYHGLMEPTREYPSSFRGCMIGILGSIKALIRPRKVYAEIGGRSAPVLGAIGMVQTVCDVTDIPCQAGDTAVLPVKPLLHKGLPLTYRDGTTE